MWVQPTMTSGSSLGRSKWKMVQQSLQFLLQQGPSSNTKDGFSYRIVTRSFPTYIVASSETLPPSLDHFRFLHEEFLEQMPAKKPKELVKNLKLYYLDFPEYQEPQNDEAEFSEEQETANLNERIEKALSKQLSPDKLPFYNEENSESEDEAASNSPTLSLETNATTFQHKPTVEGLVDEQEQSCLPSPVDSTYGSAEEETVIDPSILKPKSRNNCTQEIDKCRKKDAKKESTSESLFEPRISVIPGPLVEPKPDEKVDIDRETKVESIPEKELSIPKENIIPRQQILIHYGMRVFNTATSFFSLPQGVQEIPDDSNVWTFPLKFHTFLHYPSMFLEDGVTRKSSYQFLKEVQAVNTRRKVLVGLTLYSLVLRFCSLDLFFVILFGTNCGVLYFMKNSTKVNLTIAKKAMKSKVGLAKQWAGGFISKPRPDVPSEEDNTVAPTAATKIARRASLFFRRCSVSSPSALPSVEVSKIIPQPSNLASYLPANRAPQNFNLRRSTSIGSVLPDPPMKPSEATQTNPGNAIVKPEAAKSSYSRKLRTLSLIFPLNN